MGKIKIGVALGSGGMCGISHIGFLQVLEENGIKIDIISGSSMGSVVGGLYAGGMDLKEMEKRFLELTKGDVLDLNYFQILKTGVFSGKKIEKLIEKFCPTKRVEDCKIKFLPVTVDAVEGKVFVFEKGLLKDAIRASSAIPGIFSPVVYENKMLIDGGALETVPVKELKENNADVIIAVNCLNDYIFRPKPKSTIELLGNSLDIMQDALWRHQKEEYKNIYDIYIRDNLEGVIPMNIELDKIAPLIKAGREKALESIDLIKDIIKQKEQAKK